MPSDPRSERICRCQHPSAAHQHYRAGAACALCEQCPRFRPVDGVVARLIALLPARLRPPPASS